jgi:16S rRNA processing protein RimM
VTSPRLILVGQVAGAFGVKGELKITAYTDDPMALTRYRRLLREDGSSALTLETGRMQGAAVIARAREVATREDAQALRGLRLYIPRESLPPTEADEFYLADLIGLAAKAPDGAPLGHIRSVHNFGAGDLLEIEPADGGATWWAPFTLAVVPEVRIAEGFVVVDRPAEVSE